MPYRDPHRPLPACSACSAKVPSSDLLFSDDGSLVCGRCRAIEDGRKQIRRAYDPTFEEPPNLYEESPGNEGARMLERAYAELAKATATPPPLVRGLVPCVNCQRSVHRSEIALNARQEPVCRQCRWKGKKGTPES
ncbi:hypothetical protein LZC95_49570 [Pendulispora brunnea]|uniref:DksA C4-type domain-containing protein n=1 Tax=Pendulispora brunnea TaxID=2905690 RepID=A0ABZ2K720_9BACT